MTDTGPDRHAVKITVNGSVCELTVEGRRTLADTLREELGLTGTHLACEHGVCGSCTVVLDGEPARSCLMLAVQADGREVETVESLADGHTLHPLQQAMKDCHAFQCAFCAPGFLMTAKCLLERNADPTREQIREELSGNLCRCTGYQTIVDGVRAAAALLADPAGTDGRPGDA